MRSLTFGAYLTSQWLPAKKLHLATSTYRGYERNVQRHILPVLGKTSIRRLRYQQIESLYEALLHPTPAAVFHPRPSTRSTSSSAGRSPTPHRRGLVTRNVAARGPRAQATVVATHRRVALTDEELRQLLRTARATGSSRSTGSPR